MFGGNKVTKTIKVEGMSCMHCAKKVETALKEIKQVKSVKVILEEKIVEITLKEDIDIKILENTIEDLGYQVIK